MFFWKVLLELIFGNITFRLFYLLGCMHLKIFLQTLKYGKELLKVLQILKKFACDLVMIKRILCHSLKEEILKITSITFWKKIEKSTD